VAGIHGFFHSTGFVIVRNLAVVLSVAFWLALGFWVRKDARRRTGDPLLVLFATLLGLVPPYVGPLVYLLFRPSETIANVRARRAELRALEQYVARSRSSCPVCGTRVEPDYLACPVCATTLREPCARCDAPLEPLWQICPYCVAPVEPPQIDLDAALTAEARSLGADEGVPLIPQPEPRIAEV
jgi:Double zinc ribbon